MNVFDLIGPIMIGPSSSHTAGAVRIGRVLHDLLGGPPRSVLFELHQSFARTGPGHGTPQALMAGLLGMRPDDERIPRSLEMARDLGIDYEFRDVDLKDAHPNSVRISAVSADGSCRMLQGSSIGGGVIRVTSIDDLRSYEAIVDSQANGLKKFVPAFEALYGTLSDSQKHAADAEFTRFQPPASRPAHQAAAKS